MMIAREKGRSLELIVGGGEDALTYLVPPINSQTGAKLLSEWAGIAFGVVDGDQALNSARNVGVLSLGQDVYDQLAELRWAEQEQIVNAAFLWNVQGGGIELVNEFLSAGFPKARETLLQVTGLMDAYSLLLTSLVSESESPTSTGDSPATSTPSGGETPAGPA